MSQTLAHPHLHSSPACRNRVIHSLPYCFQLELLTVHSVRGGVLYDMLTECTFPRLKRSDKCARLALAH